MKQLTCADKGIWYLIKLEINVYPAVIPGVGANVRVFDALPDTCPVYDLVPVQ